MKINELVVIWSIYILCMYLKKKELIDKLMFQSWEPKRHKYHDWSGGIVLLLEIWKYSMMSHFINRIKHYNLKSSLTMSNDFGWIIVINKFNRSFNYESLWCVWIVLMNWLLEYSLKLVNSIWKESTFRYKMW